MLASIFDYHGVDLILLVGEDEMVSLIFIKTVLPRIKECLLVDAKVLKDDI